jgi:DNA polymerase eta
MLAEKNNNTTAGFNDRVICLIDMDCFYVQVEEVAAPEYRGKPCGVAQYNPYKGGG